MKAHETVKQKESNTNTRSTIDLKKCQSKDDIKLESRVVVTLKKKEFHGTVRWLGNIESSTKSAGLELVIFYFIRFVFDSFFAEM